MTEPKWQITVAVPLSLDNDKRHGLFSRVADAVHDWEGDHGGADWDTDVYGQPAPTVDPTMETDEDRRMLQMALHCAETGNAGHWPTVAGVLADEVKRLRGLSADPATIERVAAAVLAAMRDLSRESRWWAAMRTVEIPDNEQAAKFISEAAVRALQGEA